MMFLPTTRKEMKQRGWPVLDIILVSGDSYIDSPYIGIALIGRLLEREGYRVGIIAQPDIESAKDITRLGEPELFWGVSGGCIDSMVANYTASKKRRKNDDYTPGGKNDRRPDRAVIVYSNLIRKHFKRTRPIVLGGIEASLRRVAHYDFWSDKIRKSVLFDAKADFLVYGMGEKAIVELAAAFRDEQDPKNIKGLCYVSREPVRDYKELPSFAEVASDKKAFSSMFNKFYSNQDSINGKGLIQKHDTRYLVHNPPAECLTQSEMDAIYDMSFTREQHPYYESRGKVHALQTIRFSIATHRGCYGECNFCAISVHEGRTIQWRSQKSIIREAETIAALPDFKGRLHDVGGPTANMYGYECERKLERGMCKNKRCLHPNICKHMPVDHARQISLLKKLRAIDGIRKISIASGLRYDMILSDRKHGVKFMNILVAHHISGQLKIAPEHVDTRILNLMGKPSAESLDEFRQLFDKCNRKTGKKQFLTYYLIAAHPGCNQADMDRLSEYASVMLKLRPEQVQIFTPLPSTWSAVMYYTECDPFTGNSLFVEKTLKGTFKQKETITSPPKLPPRTPVPAKPVKRQPRPGKPVRHKHGYHKLSDDKPLRRKPSFPKPTKRKRR